MKYIIKEGAIPPLEVEIKGTSYQITPINNSVWKQLKEIEKRIRGGDPGAIFEQMYLLTNAPHDVIDGLEFREVLGLVDFISTNMLKAPLKGLPEAEKNGSVPGPTTSQ